MKALAILVLAIPLFAQTSPTPAREPESSWAIRGAVLIDGTGGSTTADSTIVGHGRFITCAGNASRCPVPAAAAVLDARGKWIVPGLIDTHVHLRWTEQPEETRRDQTTRLAFGITTTRDAGTSKNLEANLAARTRVDAADVPEPRLVVSGLISTENVQRYGARNVTDLVHVLAALGVDAIKIKQERTDDEIQAIVKEAHRLGLPVFGHTWAEGRSHLDAALTAGIDGLSHMATISAFGQAAGAQRPPSPGGLGRWIWSLDRWQTQDDARLQHIVESAVAQHIWLEPLLVNEVHFTLPYPFDKDQAYLADSPTMKSVVRSWIPFGEQGSLQINRRRSRVDAVYPLICKFVQSFHDRGGVVVTGTDEDPAGPALLKEIQLLNHCGLSPMEAIQAATLRAAAALKRPDFGTLEAGKFADAVVLDADPLLDLANLTRVWRVVKGGHIYDPAALLAPRIAAHRTALRIAYFSWSLGVLGLLSGMGLTAVLIRNRRRAAIRLRDAPQT